MEINTAHKYKSSTNKAQTGQNTSLDGGYLKQKLIHIWPEVIISGSS